jgi:hypothetical protein
MEGERELTMGLLSKGASFRLIAKLTIDKEILAETDEDAPEPPGVGLLDEGPL